MEVQELKQLIKQNNLPNFLIFTGEEWRVQQLYIDKIAEVTQLKKVRLDSVLDVWKSLSVKSMLTQGKLYVLMDDKDLVTNEKLYTELENKLGTHRVILVLSNADKRLKVLKLHKDKVVEFTPLKPEMLKQYIQKEIPLSDRNAEILMEVCDYNYGHCLLEIDKILHYVNGCVKEYGKPCDVDIDGVFKSLLEDGTIYTPPKDVLWDFIKFILQDKPSKAYSCYTQLQEIGTSTLVLLSNLYNNAKQLLQVQTCPGSNIAKTTGLTSWQIRGAQECVNIYTDSDIVYLMKLIQKLERGIKQGTIEESVCIDYLITDFFG